MLVDTDVIIWYLRGNTRAYDLIESLDNFFISAVTYMELVQGMRNKNELNLFRKSLHNWGTEIIYITEEISAKAVFFIEEFYLSNSVEIADSLIASTAIVYGLPLITGNDKHYKPLKNLQIKVFRPEE